EYPTIQRNDVRLILIEGGPDLVGMVRPSLRRWALKELRRRGVEVRLNTQITGYDGSTATLSDGTAIAAGTLAWAAGVRAAGLAASTGLPQNRGGRIEVTPTLQPPGRREVY